MTRPPSGKTESPPCGSECESEYRCSCGRCHANCVCALGPESARCDDASVSRGEPTS